MANETSEYQSLSEIEDSKLANDEARKEYLAKLEAAKQVGVREHALRDAKEKSDAANESALQKEIQQERESQQIRQVYPKM